MLFLEMSGSICEVSSGLELFLLAVGEIHAAALFKYYNSSFNSVIPMTQRHTYI